MSRYDFAGKLVINEYGTTQFVCESREEAQRAAGKLNDQADCIDVHERHALDARNREHAAKVRAETAEVVEAELRDALNTALDRAKAAEARVTKLREALEAIVKRPDGCPWCDSGVLRNPEKGHGPDCGFAKAGALAASLAPCTHNAGVYQFEGDFRCKGCDAPMPDDAGKKKEGASR